MSTIYNVITRYHADHRPAERGLSKLERRLGNLEKRAERAKGKLRGIGTAIKIGLGTAVAGGVALATHQLFKLQRSIQGAKISLATMFESNGLNTFEDGLGRATGLIEKFRETAATSPGTEFEMLDIARNMLPALAKAAPTDKEITGLAAQVMGAAHTSMDGDIQQASMDVQRILQGSASVGENRLYTMFGTQMNEALGVDSTEAFNKVAKGAGGTRKVFGAIVESLQSMKKANAAFGDSFVGQWSTLKAYAQNTILGAGGVFDAMTDELKGLNQWYRDNKEEVMDWAASVGDGLTWAFEKVTSAVKILVDNVDVLATGLALVAARKAAVFAGDTAALLGTSGVGKFATDYIDTTAKMGRGVRNKLNPRNIKAGFMDFAAELMVGDMAGFGNRVGKGGIKGRKRGLGSRMARGLKAGGSKVKRGAKAFMRAGMSNPGVAIDAMSAGMAARGGIGGMAKSALGGAAGAAAGGVSAITGALASLASIAGPIAVVIGMVVGTFQVMRDETSFIANYLREQFHLLMLELDSLAASMGGEGGFFATLKSVSRWLGTGVVGVLSLVTLGIRKLVEGFNYLLIVIKGLAGGLANLYMQYQNAGGGLAGLKALDAGEAFGSAFIREENEYKARKKAQAKRIADEKKKEEEEEKKKKKREEDKKKLQENGGTTTNVTVILNQENHTEANPERIAVKAVDLMTTFFEGKKVSIPKAGFKGN